MSMPLHNSICTRLTCSVLVFMAACAWARIDRITATPQQIQISLKQSDAPLTIVELQPNEPVESALGRTPVLTHNLKPMGRKTIDRFDGDRDRIYSAFVALADGKVVGNKRFVEEWNHIARHRVNYAKVDSTKGLQVQMLDDAIALGVRHAALNVNLATMISLNPATNDVLWKMDGQTYPFQRTWVESLDKKVKTLSDTGATVTLILLSYKNSNPEVNRLMLHPKYDEACPNHLGAFNTVTSEGMAWFKACLEFLAERYSHPDKSVGRAVNFIVGNEVNSHWYWANMGRVSMEDFTEDYLRTVRICHTAVRKFSSAGRVFISLEHHWNSRFPVEEGQSFAGRSFVDHFARRARDEGDFGWHVAFHPYPEDLFQCRTWNDQSTTDSFDTPRITFKNLEVLPRYLRKKELLYQGKPRRIILSEQGFHSDGTPEGELAQAAAYCYAYYKTARLDGIDSFILHRHVDHGGEFGLNLGLWRRDKSSPSPSVPLDKKPIYDVFLQADSPQWEKAFEFALPVIGITSWKDIDPRRR